jgi:hypothetical protein
VRNRPRQVLLLLSLALALALPAGTSAAQNPDDPLEPLPEEAKSRLDYAVGDWSVRTEFLDPEGQVRSVEESIHEARFSIPGRLVELTSHTPSTGPGVAWLFYNVQEQRFYLTSVDQRGDYWVMSGGLDRYVLTSQPKTLEDGSTLTARLSYMNMTADSYQTLMEVSLNDGTSWMAVFRQTITRRDPAAQVREDKRGSPE